MHHNTRHATHLVQYITVEPTLRCAYLLGPAAYRASHATLRAIDAMWAGTTPCHAPHICPAKAPLAPVVVASC